VCVCVCVCLCVCVCVYVYVCVCVYVCVLGSFGSSDCSAITSVSRRVVAPTSGPPRHSAFTNMYLGRAGSLPTPIPHMA